MSAKRGHHFVRRLEGDGTVHAFSMTCLQTVAKSLDDAELTNGEKQHKCPGPPTPVEIERRSKRSNNLMIANNSTLYRHRRNEDGSYDSICRVCFESVARCKQESKLAQYEKVHECHSA